MKHFFFALLFLFSGQQLLAQKTTTIWVVRHAEKDTSNPKDNDPDLSDEGKARAEDLLAYLKSKNLDSIFSSNYKRTKLTGFPLADKIGISIKLYDPNKQKFFAEQLLKDAAGKKMLIIGHSNTILELIAAFGVEKPVNALNDEDYDYIFRLTIKGDKREVKVDHYGKEHHSQP